MQLPLIGMPDSQSVDDEDRHETQLERLDRNLKEMTGELLNKRRVGRGDRVQVAAHAGDAEQPLDLRRARGERQPPATLHRALVCGEEDPQTGGVDELDVVEIEDEDISRVDRVALDLALQPWRGGQIELAMERQHDPVRLLPDLDSELLPQDHKYSCYRTGLGRIRMPSSAISSRSEPSARSTAACSMCSSSCAA